MRNLKRALSLVLATAMLIGMMVFGASAAGYKDSDTVNNDTAVEVLSALDIVGGDENGNFRPASTLTRAEFCVMIANVLTGGTFDKALFEGTATPFTDIQGHWGAPFIAFCYSSGVIAGTTATTFSPDANLTSAQAEAILLSVLGYNKNGEFAANDQFELNVTSWAQRVGLMDNLTVAANAAITRDNTAQLMFNTLTRAVPVEYNDSFGVYYNALGRGTDWFAGVQFRYNETLGYTNFDLVYDKTSEDDFGRLGTEWGTGTVVRLDDDGNVSAANIRQHITTQLNTPELSYTTAVKEREIYRALNLKQTTNKLPYYLDGVSPKDPMTINDDRDKNVENSGTGVLTEVYKEGDSYRIVFINTFLAQATSDYNARNDQVNLKVYKYDAARRTVATKDNYPNKDYPEPILSVKGEDIAVAMDLVQDDFVLVTIADGVIKTIADPEIIASATLSAFSDGKYVVTGGVTYNYAEAIDYNVKDALPEYDYPNLKDLTYTLYLDPYGNLIGIELDQEANQYLFVTGIDVYGSMITNSRAVANVIFLDGTMATIDIKKFDLPSLVDKYGDSKLNKWCTYSVDEGNEYTIKEVATQDTTLDMDKVSAVQAWSYYSNSIGEIDSNHPGLSALQGYNWNGTALNKVAYSNDDSVFIIAEVEDDSTSDLVGAITGVDSVTTGIKNVDISVAVGTDHSHGVYTLYDTNYYVIGAVVVGEDTGTKNSHVFYALGGVELEEYGDGSWTWSVDGILDGQEATLHRRGRTTGSLDLPIVGKKDASLRDFELDYAYEISNDADGYVTEIKDLTHLKGSFKLNDDGEEVDIASKNIEVKLDRKPNEEPYQLHIEGWTLYLTDDATDGVVIANECPSALVEIDEDNHATTTYYDDAQSAIRAMETNKVMEGKLVASVNKDRMVTSLVIVVKDYADTGIGGGTETPPTVDSKYEIRNDFGFGGQYGQFTFTVATKADKGGKEDASFTWQITANGEVYSGPGQLNQGTATIVTGLLQGVNSVYGTIRVVIDNEVIEREFHMY